MKRITISSLKVVGVGQPAEREALLQPGLNLICGGHESGKTLLTRAVSLCLPERTAGSREAAEGRAVLELLGGDGRVRIERSLPGGDLKVSPIKAPGEEGSPDSAEELRLWLKGREELGTALRTEMPDESLRPETGLGSFISGVLESGFLEDLLRTSGRLGEEEWELKQLGKRLESVEKEWYRLQGGEAEISLGIRMTPVVGDGEREAPLEKNLPDTRADQAGVPRDVSPDGPLGRARAEREQLLRELRRTGLPVEMPEDLPAILRESEEIRQELINLQKESAEIRRQLLEQAGLSWLLPILMTLALVVGGAALGWQFGNFWLGLLGGAVLSLPGWLLGFRRLLRVRTARARLKGQGQVIEDRRAGIQQRLALLDARFEGIGMSPSAVEIVRMQKNLGRHQELRDRLREIEGALNVLDGEGPPGAEAQEEENVETEPVPEIKKDGGGDEPAEEKQPFDREGHTASDRLREVETEGETLHQRLKFLENRIRWRRGLLSEVLGSPFEGGEEIRTALEDISAELSETWAAWSGQRYRKVCLNPLGKTVELEAADGSRMDWKYLSEGLRSALNLLAAMTCALKLDAERMPWVVLDDPFDLLDPTRQLKAAKLMEAAVRNGRQILVTSRDPSWLRYVRQSRWHVIDLEKDAGAREPVALQKEANSDVRQLHLL